MVPDILQSGLLVGAREAGVTRCVIRRGVVEDVGAGPAAATVGNVSAADSLNTAPNTAGTGSATGTVGVTVAIDDVTGNQPAVGSAVFSIANVVALVARIASTRANDPVGGAASAGRRRASATPVIVGAGALGIRAIEVRAGRTAA